MRIGPWPCWLLFLAAVVVAEAARSIDEDGSLIALPTQHCTCERERRFITKILSKLSKFGGVEQNLLGEGKSLGFSDTQGNIGDDASSPMQQRSVVALDRLLSPQGPVGKGVLGEGSSSSNSNSKKTPVAHEKATEEALRAVESACESSQKASAHLRADPGKGDPRSSKSTEKNTKLQDDLLAAKEDSKELNVKLASAKSSHAEDSKELKAKLESAKSAKVNDSKQEASQATQVVARRMKELEASLAKSEAKRTAALTLLAQKDKLLLEASTLSITSANDTSVKALTTQNKTVLLHSRLSGAHNATHATRNIPSGCSIDWEGRKARQAKSQARMTKLKLELKGSPQNGNNLRLKIRRIEGHLKALTDPRCHVAKDQKCLDRLPRVCKQIKKSQCNPLTPANGTLFRKKLVYAHAKISFYADQQYASYPVNVVKRGKKMKIHMSLPLLCGATCGTRAADWYLTNQAWADTYIRRHVCIPADMAPPKGAYMLNVRKKYPGKDWLFYEGMWDLATRKVNSRKNMCSSFGINPHILGNKHAPCGRTCAAPGFGLSQCKKAGFESMRSSDCPANDAGLRCKTCSEVIHLTYGSRLLLPLDSCTSCGDDQALAITNHKAGSGVCMEYEKEESIRCGVLNENRFEESMRAKGITAKDKNIICTKTVLARTIIPVEHLASPENPEKFKKVATINPGVYSDSGTALCRVRKETICHAQEGGKSQSCTVQKSIKCATVCRTNIVVTGLGDLKADEFPRLYTLGGNCDAKLCAGESGAALCKPVALMA